MNLKFRYARAKNCLCFGDEGIELFFEDYGPVVVVKGINKDTGCENNPASNGAGKSSLQDFISLALFGKTVKSPKRLTNAVVVNRKAGKGMEVEVQFGEYRVVRRRDPTSLKLWRSKDHLWNAETEITRGTMKDTQDDIEGIIGLSHLAFCNVVVFDDSKMHSFLESDAPTKRIIVENLLGLDQYRDYHDHAKELQKDAKDLVKSIAADYERLQNDLSTCQERITKIGTQEKAWRQAKVQEASGLMARLKSKQEELEKLDGGAELLKYQEVQSRIEELRESIEAAKSKKVVVVEALSEVRKKVEESSVYKDELNKRLQAYNIKMQQTQAEMKRSENLVTSLEKLEEGTICPICKGLIDKSNYESVLAHELHILEQQSATADKNQAESNVLLEELKKYQGIIVKLKEHETKTVKELETFDSRTQQEITEMNRLAKLPKPDLNAKQQVLESEIVELKSQMKQKREELEGGSPYKEIFDAAVLEKAEKQKSSDVKAGFLKDAEEEVPYYDFWVKAFGDSGIRRFIVDGIIPALNSRVAYWMQILYEGKIELSFDNELIETITRNGTFADYHAMSNGEQQRINLAVSQSFSYVMTLNSGGCPSLVFLDEITGGGIDKVGINGVFNMICELAKERQVFVTTHNQYLLTMLDGCETLTLVKENDVSRLLA